MSTISTFILDDQQACIDVLAEDLKSYSFIELVGTATAVNAGKDMILIKQPDLIFIDVEMPQRSGIELIREIQPYLHSGISIVFYSAFDKYMLDAIRLSAFDFLLKPYTRQELHEVIMRVKDGKNIDPKQIWSSLSALLSQTQKKAIQTITETIMVYIDDIVCFQFSNDAHCWSVLLSDMRKLPIKKTNTAKDLLSLGKALIQINQSCILNTKYIVSIENTTLRCILVPPFNELELFMSRRCFARLREGISVI